ncbi:hypothetical protein C4D60_Mb06t02010 [Musa balbisiana]|uniref:Uncharacterized protein n=1 Tax=Musa balbisiana TaxID=52838 RepID=A0A4S8IME4_MUSBA|nr:hypothetical protein C4D60_Mb06t02010 [Musa balbisiana]
MKNDAQKHQDDGAPRNGRSGGNGFFSVRSLSNYMRIVSSGASNVASNVRSAGASIVSSISNRHDDAGRDQVYWAGFDKLECEGGHLRQVLLLGYRSGFQVWDVELADDVRQLVSRHDGPVSFLQMQKKLIPSKYREDKFADVRPLLIVVEDSSVTLDGNDPDGCGSPCNKSNGHHDLGSDNLLSTYLRFYSLRTHDYVHVLKFRAAVFSVRCSSRVIVVCQATQIHCLDAATLEREYTVLTYPIVPACPGSGGIGYGPLAIGTRWLAYSGNPVAFSSTGRVSPQHMYPATGVSVPHSNGSLVANFAKESSKQLAAGLVTLGDMGYKKLSKYYSDFLVDNNGSGKQGNSSLKLNGTMNGQQSDTENAGMVIIRDIISKSVIAQFRAHSSPISALCFDPSGMLLVTASIHGHNINIFGIVPSPRGGSTESDIKGTCIHLYRLQRGITNAIIQDISFSDDSKWIMISSSRGTSHLFALPAFGAAMKPHLSEGKFANSCYESGHLPYSSSSSKHSHQSLFASGTPLTLSAVSRIRNGSNGLKGAVSGAAAAATGKVSPLYGAIASAFHNCKGSGLQIDISSVRTQYYLLVFAPSGCIIQYVLRQWIGENYGIIVSGSSNASYQSIQEADGRLDVEALQKWDVCHKRNRRDRSDNVDIYGDHGNDQSAKIFQKGLRKGTSIYPAGSVVDMKGKLSGEETHHAYLSEVELHVHEACTPLWAKSEVCFQVMIDENIKEHNSSNIHGEIEIEKITSCTIETRSKDLIPVFDYLQTPMFQQPRTTASVVNKLGSIPRQKSGLLESGRLSHRSSSSSLDCISDNATMAELPNDVSGIDWSRSFANANKGFVHNTTNSQNIRDQLKFVNGSDDLKLEAQLEPVDNMKNLKIQDPLSGYDNGIC